MGTLNWSRIMLGGLLAGVVISAGELIAAGFLRKQYQAAMQSLGRSLEVLTAWDLALSLLVTLGVGVFAVWLYAAIRPRYGAGPRTAVIAGVATWLMQGSSNLRYASQGLFPLELLAIGPPSRSPNTSWGRWSVRVYTERQRHKGIDAERGLTRACSRMSLGGQHAHGH